jgi:hypothetical protein
MCTPESARQAERPKEYDGKIDWEAVRSDLREQLARFDEVAPPEDQPQIRVLTTVANSPHLKRNLRIVVLLGSGERIQAILCSTDPEQPAEEILRFADVASALPAALPDRIPDSRRQAARGADARAGP